MKRILLLIAGVVLAAGGEKGVRTLFAELKKGPDTFFSKPAASADTPKAPTAGDDIVIKTLPGIIVDTKAKEVRLACTFCFQKGPIELFACGPNTREYESVIVTKAKPSHVTFALSLLGLAPGRPGGQSEGGAFSPAAGEVLDITARYAVTLAADGAKKTEVHEVPIWKLLKTSAGDRALDRAIEWVYVGRPEEAALRGADREGSVICLSNFYEAVMDVPFESPNAYAQLLYRADPDVVPPAGTPVELIIRPTGRRLEPKKVEISVILQKGKPVVLDGKPLELEEFKSAVNGQPADVRAAVLRVDAEEKFGRAMEIYNILRDALMNIHMAVLEPGAPAKPALASLEVQLTADDKVRVGGKTFSVEEFRAKAGELLKDVDRVYLAVAAKTSPKAVAEVMSAARDRGATVSIRPRSPDKE